MTTPETKEAVQTNPEDVKTVFGFWVYIMTDCVLFATLFAAFQVLRYNTFGSPGAKELFYLPLVLLQTIILLTSSFTCGLAVLETHKKNMQKATTWFWATFALGLLFVALEIYEFHHIIALGYGPHKSAFLSAFFTLVGTHGLHVTFGLIWIIFLVLDMKKHGIDEIAVKRQTCFSLFWHFLDIVWIFIFTIVYLMGVL